MVHTHIQSYRSAAGGSGSGSDSTVVKLFCCGFYEEICVIDPLSLKVMFSLASRINPDWIAAFHVLRSVRPECGVHSSVSATNHKLSFEPSITSELEDFYFFPG